MKYYDLVNPLTLDIMSDLAHGKAFDFVDKRREPPESTSQWKQIATVKFALFRVFSDKIRSLCKPYGTIYDNVEAEHRQVSQVAGIHVEERKHFAKESVERIDIVSTLLAAHDLRTGARLTESEVWDELYLIIKIGKSEPTIHSLSMYRLTEIDKQALTQRPRPFHLL